MDEIRILQLGDVDWSTLYALPEAVDFHYADAFLQPPKDAYDMVFLDRAPLEEEIEPLQKATKAYTLFVTEKVEIRDRLAWLCECKKAQRIPEDDIQKFLLQEVRFYYSKPYGEKFHPEDLAIAQGFSGSVKWNGQYSVVLQGEFGEEFSQAVFWRYNISLSQGQMLDLWLEYKKTSGVEISLVLTQVAAGGSDIINRRIINEQELEQIVQIENKRGNSYIFASLHAKGSGELQVIALHDRHSRGSHGYFLPGGERHVASNREEIFSYFDPGDRKPPLNVYFSGYKTAQGFEGYYMMRGMGCPFLLVSEARLQGGSFYMGTEEYEKLLVDVIRKYIAELGFTSEQVILSGLSMGTYGALYYGCDIKPHAMVLGKPLASIGNVAANEKYLRPQGFSTSLDVLRYLCGSMDSAAVEGLNNRFWKKFDATDWGKSKFIVSYMIEDDYDSDAYDTLISHLRSGGVQVYGKGIHGRHNDNTPAIVNWFSSQLKKILREDFSRKIGN